MVLSTGGVKIWMPVLYCCERPMPALILVAHSGRCAGQALGQLTDELAKGTDVG